MQLLKRHKAELNYIVFEVTPRCNLHCLYCYNHWKRPEENQPEEASYKMAKKVLSRLFHSTSLKHVTFSGGEPLLFDRLQELILYCRMKGATVSVITNGSKGDSTYFSELIKLGVQLFEVPMHSPTSHLHDQMTRGLGSWEKAKRTIELIRKLGGYVVPVIVITKYNFHVVDETLEHLHKMGLQRVMLNRYNIGGEMMIAPEKIVATKEELNQAFHHANEAAEMFRMEISSNVCTPHCLIAPESFPRIAFSNCSPDLTRRPLTISASGDLRFCNHSPSVLGNVLDTPIHKIIEKSKCDFAEFTVPAFCSDCSKYTKCLGGCRAAAEQAGQTIKSVDPIVYHTLKTTKEQTA